MAHRPLTGVLLVGGRSERFGSPKALARLGGRTLAERCLATLRAACDEVHVVGKDAPPPGIEAPFVDDGTTEHAPAFGVVAALEASTTDTCVVVPVDCVRLSPAAIRRLADERAVSPTGPLPGAYGQEHLEPLRRRLAAGKLTLRGLNERRSTLPAALLADVDTPDELGAYEGPGHVVIADPGLPEEAGTALASLGHVVSRLADVPDADELFRITAARGPFALVVGFATDAAALSWHAAPFARVFATGEERPATPFPSHVSVEVLDVTTRPRVDQLLASLGR